MTPADFIARWAASGGAEMANAQTFVNELCDVLGVPRPDPTVPNEAANLYTFEKAVKHTERGVTSTNRIDCYKRGCFVLEAKQSSSGSAKAARDEGQGDLLPEHAAPVRGGTAKRGTPGWDRAMRRAYMQAKGYVGDLPADHPAPPFLVLVDVGHVIELYADFTGQGRNYTQFPSRTDFRITLDDLRHDKVRERLALVWTEPNALNPSIKSAEVTADIAKRLAKVARGLEGKHDPETVATFLMRCLFTMFAEDVELLPKDSFKDLLGELRDRPDTFVPALEHLWRTMDEGGFEPRTAAVLRKFNGSLFKDRTALPLERDAIHELFVAAGRDWRDVEPAIFGTLLERALDPRDRSKLGAHYTPRAYVERLVIPTVIEPLREDWQDAQARMAELVDAGDTEAAFEVASAFHHQLCTTRVLDPACGTGNFLYVALELLKRLEGEVLEAIDGLGEGTTGRLAMLGETVDPRQFLGLELNPRAVPIADLVLWIGYLKWQLANGGLKAVSDPVLHAYGTIRQQDAVLAYDSRTLRRDEHGKPVSTWDGYTTKPHPVTGAPVPDETARVEAYTYANPKRADWPEAEFIVGNPPFIGSKKMRAELGDGYAEAVWKARPEVSGEADFVMQWWDEAARRLARKATKAKPNPLRRFGFITTNSITQSWSRAVVENHLTGKHPLSLSFAVPDHPWVKGDGRAAVRIAMTVVQRGRYEGTLGEVTAERDLDTDAPIVRLWVWEGTITPKLTLGADVTRASELLSNVQLAFQGVKVVQPRGLKGGFLLSEVERTRLTREDGLPALRTPRRYAGSDLKGGWRGVFYLDLFGLDIDRIRSSYPKTYQRLLDTVKPFRNRSNVVNYKARWWTFGEPRPDMRSSLAGLNRYLGTVETSKHRYLVPLSWPDELIDGSVIGIALDTSATLAILSSRVHVWWALCVAGRLEDRPRYQHDAAFGHFAFPPVSADHSPSGQTNALRDRLRELGERLDTFRTERLDAVPDLTMTELYNRLERYREAMHGGAPLNEDERADHKRAHVTILAELHDDIDRAVLHAYGWDDLADALVGRPGGTTPSPHKSSEQEAAEDDLLSRLVDLNRERAAEEARGHVRWLRPEYQIPKLGAKVPQPDDAEQADLDVAVSIAPDGMAWPAEPRAQFGAVRELLDGSSEPLPHEAIARAFKGRLTPKRRARVDEVLAIMADLGTVRSGEREGRTLFYTRR